MRGLKNIGNTCTRAHSTTAMQLAVRLPHRSCLTSLLPCALSLTALCVWVGFLNCILQALASLPAFGVYLGDLLRYAQAQQATLGYDPVTVAAAPLPSAFSSSTSSQYPSSSALHAPASSMLLLHQFLACFHGEVSNPTALYRSLVSEARQFKGFQQNDSHELFLSILHLLAQRASEQRPSSRWLQHSQGFTDLLTDPALAHPTVDTQHKLEEVKMMEEELKVEATYADEKAAPAAADPPAAEPASPPALPCDPFQGLLAQFLVCRRCGYQSPVSHSSFLALSLPLPRSPSVSTWDIHRCLLEFCSAEEVEGVRCALCSALETRKACALQMEQEKAKLTGRRRARYERLEQQTRQLDERIVDMQPSLVHQLAASTTPPLPPPRSPPTLSELFSSAVMQTVADPSSFFIAEHAVRRVFLKKTVLARLPRLLCLHLNRLCGERKLTMRVDFPALLNLAHFTAHQDDYAARGHSTPTSSSSTPPAAPPRPSSKALYRLCSVVCHHGGSGSGHFTCYRQVNRYKRVEEEETKEWDGSDEGEERMWVHVSDDDVRRVSWEEVVACEAYMLFYTRLDR